MTLSLAGGAGERGTNNISHSYSYSSGYDWGYRMDNFLEKLVVEGKISWKFGQP
jgi:hypothetical protein